jgi:hypothetical protein
MKALTKILTGAAGLAAVVGVASPASAQYYPQPGYGYGYNNNTVGQVIGQILGYGRYQYGNYGYGVGNNNMLVDQCVRAVEARLSGGGYGGYGGYGYNNYGYGNRGYGGGRVQGITSIERKNSGIRVKGVASSGNVAGYGYNGYNNAGYPDIRFNCKADFNGRVVDMDFNRINTRYGGYGYRGW